MQIRTKILNSWLNARFHIMRELRGEFYATTVRRFGMLCLIYFEKSLFVLDKYRALFVLMCLGLGVIEVLSERGVTRGSRRGEKTI